MSDLTPYERERQIRAEVRTLVGDYIRRTGVQRPSENFIRKIASGMASNLARPTGRYLTPEILKTIASDTAKYFADNWDATIARPPPMKSRGKRANERERVQQIFANTNETQSIRAVAKRLAVPKSLVQKALVTSGLSRPWEGRISPQSSRLMRVIGEYAPVDGKRIFDRAELFAAAGIADDDALLEEINSAKISTLIHDTGHPSCRGSTWVVVSRGRKPPLTKVMTWFTAAETARNRGDRNPLAPDQRKYVLDPQPAASGLEERDIAAVISVANNSRRLSDWRRYFEATIPADFIDREFIDREAILTVVQSALRLTNRPLLEHTPWTWIADNFTRELAESHFQGIQDLQWFGPGELPDMLEYWARETSLKDRIEGGSLPGRSYARFVVLFEACRVGEQEFFEGLFDLHQEHEPEAARDAWPAGFDPDELPDFLRNDAMKLSARSEIVIVENGDLGEEISEESYRDDDGFILPVDED